MNTTMDAGEPPYSTSGKHEGTFPSGLGFFFVVIFLLITLFYGSCIYKRSTFARTPPAIAIATNNHVDDNHHSIRINDFLATFPTFAYSIMLSKKGDASTDANSSGCSICLADYNPTDTLRLLPECGHSFHVSCIDTWWKVHPTCPVCRNSPLPMI